ncbi:sensor histidine kinase [Oleiagrimonas soli]|uniref:Signal transduction histidine kinase n=1 Tax=Oleiagrimonas soli TaxID=1543381 RepID=A0A841KI90_9GAMM|nr:histidine kinase [Oleiagrimonas soli]MBB6184690.1 signal transduction histidine kinase [Oleiagrimonas soli]
MTQSRFRSPDALLLERPVRFLLYVLGWVLLGLWQGSEGVISHRGDMHPPAHWENYVWELSSTVVLSVLSLAVARFENRFRITGPGWPRRLPIHVVACLVFSVVHIASMEWLRQLAYAAMGSTYRVGNAVEVFFFEFQRDLSTYLLLLLACALVRSILQRRRQQLRELELRQAVSEARLAHLTAQIEPHFIFNTLNAISNRMYEDVAAADRMVVALADLLRSAMNGEGGERIRLGEEAKWLRAYAHLMAERQPGLLHVAIRIDPALGDARIPRLLLQPLVENAFRHGLRSGRGRLEVDVWAEDGRLRCRVADDGVGLAADAEPGLGLGNVRERLALLYPDDHALRIARRAEGGTEVTLDMPLERDDAVASGHR